MLRAAPNREKELTGYGDASACLELRTPLIRRDPPFLPSSPVPHPTFDNPSEFDSPRSASVLSNRRGSPGRPLRATGRRHPEIEPRRFLPDRTSQRSPCSVRAEGPSRSGGRPGRLRPLRVPGRRDSARALPLPTSTSGSSSRRPRAACTIRLIRRPRIAQSEVDVRNRCARLPVTVRVGTFRRPRPAGTTAARAGGAAATWNRKTP